MTNCSEEAVVAMDSARIHVEACRLSGCKGPAVDISNQAHVELVDCSMQDNVGKAYESDFAS